MKLFYRFHIALLSILCIFAFCTCATVREFLDIEQAEQTAQNTRPDHTDREILRQIDQLKMEIAQLREDMRRENFTVLCSGDIMIANKINTFIEKEGEGYPVARLENIRNRYDVFFANLETPITSSGISMTEKAYILKMDPSLRFILSHLGINVVSLANNHIMDYGVTGLQDTIVFCQEQGIKATGAGYTLNDARKPARITLGPTDVVFLAYCGRPPDEFFAAPDRAGTSPLLIDHILDDIERYKNSNTVVLVSLHWGIEQRSVPLKSQKSMAHAIIDGGADAIIGHHPHWPQGIEIYRGKPVIYSLGNFINGYTNRIEKDNFMAVLHFRRTDLDYIEVIPLAGKNSRIHFQPYVQRGGEAADNLKELELLCRKMDTDMEIVGDRGIIRCPGNSPAPLAVP